MSHTEAQRSQRWGFADDNKTNDLRIRISKI